MLLRFIFTSVTSLIFYFLLCSNQAIAAVDIVDDVHIKSLEKQLASSCYSSRKRKKDIFRDLNEKIQEGRNNFQAPIIDLTGKSLSYMVSELAYVLQKKTDLRRSQSNPDSPYRIQANLRVGNLGIGYTNADENGVDPYVLTIRLGNEQHRLMHNYDGGGISGNIISPNQHQPGNFRLRRSVPTSQTISYDSAITGDAYNQDSHRLLRALEIARRKITDTHREKLGFEDRYSNIPVTAGVLMATRLIEDNKINVNDFWRKPYVYNPRYPTQAPHTHGDYHIFTGDDRRSAFNRLAHKYKQEYLLPNSSVQELTNHIKTQAAGVFGFGHLVPEVTVNDIIDGFGEFLNL